MTDRQTIKADWATAASESRGRKLASLIVLAAVAGAIAWNFYFKPRRDMVHEPPVVVEQAPPETQTDIAPKADPIPEPEPEPPPSFAPATPAETVVDKRPELPTLDESDPAVLGALQERFSGGVLERLLITDDIIRKIVVSVDNLPREIVSMKVRAVRATPQEFLTYGDDDDITLDPSNYLRYTSIVQLVTAIDPGELVDVYVNFYPLLQEAFEELGYPGQQFNTRVIEVIDHLLETPEVRGRVRLTRPHVLYRFADPDLESRSAGQKMLLRIGNKNAILAKDWLRRLQTELQGRTIS